jgi:phosphatidylinositol-3-phosphatase
MSTRRAFLVLSLLVVLVLTTAACSSSGSSKAAPTSTPTTPKTAPPPAPIGHVFVINLENENYTSIWGPASPATYLNKTLRPQGQLLTQYFGIGHASLGNYIAQISGQAPNPQTQADCPTFTEFVATGTGANGQALGDGCVYPKSVPTIADQLDAKGLTWKSYQEDIASSATEPKMCRHPAIGAGDTTLIARKTDMYATRHNPFVYFHSVIDEPSCAKNVVGLGALAADLTKAASTPNLAYITPNLCHDGHDEPCVDGQPGGLTSADRFLKTWVPKILESAAFKADGMLVITFDEAELGGDDADATACCNTPPSPNSETPGLSGPGGGRVGALVISARTKPGTTNPTRYNHYSLLCSVENVWGLDHLGFAGAPGLTCFGKDVYNQSS